VSDLYEPGAFPKALVSEATIKKWRPGGHASIDSLNKIAAGLSARLHWRVEWRDLIQADGAPLSIARRLLVLPLQTAPGYRSDHAVADGFRTSIVSRLTKVRGLELVAPRADSDQVETLASADVALQAVLREQGEQSRLDIDLTEMRTGIILWAESYTFLAADLLLAQTAIATSIADEIRAPLAVR
jgi:TolB-like protein